MSFLEVECVWAGEAIARFRVTTLQNGTVFLDLKPGTMDTLVSEYKLSFLELLPYPTIKVEPKVEDYKAKLIIEPIMLLH